MFQNKARPHNKRSLLHNIIFKKRFAASLQKQLEAFVTRLFLIFYKAQ